MAGTPHVSGNDTSELDGERGESQLQTVDVRSSEQPSHIRKNTKLTDR